MEQNSIYEYLDVHNKIRTCDNIELGTDNIYHYTYCTINLINHKFYIGKKSCKKLKEYFGSSNHLKAAITKYGKENFLNFYIKFHNSFQEADLHEEQLITLEMIKDEKCYNRQGGGKNFAVGAKHFMHEKTKLGLNPFQHIKYEDNPTVIASKNKTHRWIGKKNPTRIAINNGTHLFVGPNNPVYKLLETKSHPFLYKPWKKGARTPESQITWWYADRFYSCFKREKKYLSSKTELDSFYCKIFSKQSCQKMFTMFNDGWIPEEDIEWLNFKYSYTGVFI